jgi:hypothetical protein
VLLGLTLKEHGLAGTKRPSPHNLSASEPKQGTPNPLPPVVLRGRNPTDLRRDSREGAAVGDAEFTRDRWEALDGMGAHQSRLAMVAASSGRR